MIPAHYGSKSSKDEITDEPVGSGNYVVKKGDCIDSIALDNGFFWKSIWDDDKNRNVRLARGDPNLLLNGDRIHIPKKRKKKVPCQTENLHKFLRRGVPSKMIVQICEKNEPISNRAYNLIVDGKSYSGETDSEGRVEISIYGNSKIAVLKIYNEEKELTYDIDLAGLDPYNTPTGVQQRLSNLGYYEERITGKVDDYTRSVICQFQRENSIDESGKADMTTCKLLKNIHGS